MQQGYCGTEVSGPASFSFSNLLPLFSHTSCATLCCSAGMALAKGYVLSGVMYSRGPLGWAGGQFRKARCCLRLRQRQATCHLGLWQLGCYVSIIVACLSVWRTATVWSWAAVGLLALIWGVCLLGSSPGRGGVCYERSASKLVV
ncbi:hypothetical protein F5883DRAFT_268020 [Diaporthe sp. PMI_573]|nr:hypothetical protein F5883DRAFT_268020 [Diaporthaceae sp. PMI_573]